MNPSSTPTKQSKIMLDSLQQAVTIALEKKHKLGQYSVTWVNGKPVIKGDDAPKNIR